MGRKFHNKDSDWSEDKRLKEENKKLRREISALRKQLSRLDVDRYNHLQELIEHQEYEDKQIHSKSKKKNDKERWKCYGCEEDYLRLLILNRVDGVKYFRRCPNCGKKTKVKPYHEGVEGVTS